MSDCIGAYANDRLERYLEGTLPEDEAEKFEEHYFDCPVCLAQVEAFEAAREQLRRHPVEYRPRPRVLSWPILGGALAAIAATFLVAAFNSRIVGFLEQRHNQDAHVIIQKTPAAPEQPAGSPAGIELAQLADLRLPPYQPPTLRGESESSPFAQGMKLYAAGDCPRAVAKLAHIGPQDEDALPAQFYSGVCRMHAGDMAAAAATLHRVAAAGDSPVQESALYYLAQIALARSNVAEAASGLRKVIALHGDLEQQARAQLAQIQQKSAQK